MKCPSLSPPFFCHFSGAIPILESAKLKFFHSDKRPVHRSHRSDSQGLEMKSGHDINSWGVRMS